MTSQIETPLSFTEHEPIEISNEQTRFYQENGFVHIPNIISREEAERFRLAALEFANTAQSLNQNPIFQQLVNVWTQDEVMKQLTLHPRVGKAAEQLSRNRLRLWHDQILIKKPHNNAATEFHQDQPYWPHLNSPHPISCWIALCDVPVERGCMTFIPKSQKYTNLPPQNLSDASSLLEICPELIWEPRVTIPLKAGDCTFHHGRCAHMATPNFTDEPRVAHVIIFMDAETQFSGTDHAVTKGLDLEIRKTIEGELFPLMSSA
jgi:phytanoyl-CoA hydroxylase